MQGSSENLKKVEKNFKWLALTAFLAEPTLKNVDTCIFCPE